MLPGYSPYVQALLGTLVTWGLTALGAAVVFIIPRDLEEDKQQKLLDSSLGFAAGVMVAASYWSLLAPAIDVASASGLYGEEGQWAFVPVAIGFLIGGAFVLIADFMLPSEDGDFVTAIAAVDESKGSSNTANTDDREAQKRAAFEKRQTWRRILLLVLAITIHNFPEGLAVGVGFGGIGKSPSSTFESAVKLTLGIGLQNFPEGLSVSLPLLRLGYSPFKSFWYGQLSGMVEPLGGVLGALSVVVAEAALPYALAFAAGAMIYVVFDDLIPEAHVHGNGRLGTLGAMVGFVVMMSMDVGLG